MEENKRRYSLQLTLGCLFVMLTLALGLTVSLQNYRRTSEIIVSDARSVFVRLNRELELDFRMTYRPGAGMLELLAVADFTTATEMDQRLQARQAFAGVLRNYPAAASVMIAWNDGTFLELSRDPSGSGFEAFFTQLTADGRRESLSLQYDSGLVETRRRQLDSDFDPRRRPWYTQARPELSSTVPYRFFDSEQIGVTAMIRAVSSGAVVAVDFTLDQLADTIRSYKITPSTEVLLVNAEGKIFAGLGPDVRFEAGDPEQLPQLSAVNNGVLGYARTFLQAGQQKLELEYNRREWIGSLRKVARSGGVELYALMLVPLDELLLGARRMRDESLLVALFMCALSVPLVWMVATRVSSPLKRLALEAAKISHFDFSETGVPRSRIVEVDDLNCAMTMMKATINRFLELTRALAGEQDLEQLIDTISSETLEVTSADASLIWLLNEAGDRLTPTRLYLPEQISLEFAQADTIVNQDDLFDILRQDRPYPASIESGQACSLSMVPQQLGCARLQSVSLPLKNRGGEPVGILCLFFRQDEACNDSHMDFLSALSGFAAVTLESRQLLNMQEALLNAFIKLIAGAIDAKSPYTGGHCQRVPELTFLLARAACESQSPPFDGYSLDEQEWEALEIASWLHDCGKVTTPEYVVDKATKLQTIHDRIHEIRMRFEVLKRDARIACWQQIAEGGDRDALERNLETELEQLDREFEFVADCNLGGEFMDDETVERLHRIASRTWQRTLDDSLGISWEEARRRASTDSQKLPVVEKLLDDKAEHRVRREPQDTIAEDNPWGFRLDVPEYKYNRGELYNLTVRKGTLTPEERYQINDHMAQTIIMLEKLPFPRHLRQVPAIAGAHHETMDGKGYPRRLTRDQMSLTARMMAIADIFEALTASDRPYKKAKTLSESIRIMSFMCRDQHIDADLFRLFLESGVYLEYAKRFLDPAQIDDVDPAGVVK